MPGVEDGPRIVDVRQIAPRIRHTIVFQLFENLEPGRSFQLVHDHDPMMLRRELELRFGGRLGWTYVQQGPDTWCVRISRTTADPQDRTLASSGSE